MDVAFTSVTIPNPTEIRLRLPFSKQSPLEMIHSFKQRRSEILKRAQNYNQMRDTVKARNKKVKTLDRLEAIHKEIDLIQEKHIDQKNVFGGSTGLIEYRSVNQHISTLLNDPNAPDTSVKITLSGKSSHKYKNIV